MIKELYSSTWTGLTGRLERLPHALLVHGPRGLGKLDMARRFAQLLLCEKGGRKDPCGSCEGCRWFLGDNHPDFRQIEPEAIARFAAPEAEDEEGEGGRTSKKKPSIQIKIEQTRALRDFVNVVSHRGGRRVAIIHPAEDMNVATANSLLKMLEEPPANVVFILVSHRAASLLPTIRSRCVPVPMPIPDQKAAAAWLEGRGLRNAARWLAYAGGAPLRALEYASGPHGEAIEEVLRELASGDLAALSDVKDREGMEALTEVLQKLALDRAFLALAGRAKYSTGASAAGKGGAKSWLDFARAMGPNRLLSRHPLNPRLFAADLVAGMPKV